jgi:dihydroorotase
LRYKTELQKLDPSVDYLMTLYLSPDLTPGEIRKAKQAGIVGVPLQMYPLHVLASDRMLQV